MYHYSEGNTDSDSAECSDTASNTLSDLISHGPTAVMVQTTYSGISPDFKFENSIPFVFDDAISSTDVNHSLYSTLSTHGGSLLQNFRTVKCVKKSKKVPGSQKYIQDNSSISELLTTKLNAPHTTAWINPMHDAQISVPCAVSQPDAQLQGQYYPQQLASAFTSPNTVAPPATLIYSASMPIKIPTSVLGSLSPSRFHTRPVDLVVPGPSSNHKTLLNGLSLRERHSHCSVLAHASSPTLSDDFKMTIPSGSSIDIDENLFDDWMDDGTELGTFTEYTTEIDVPFYQSSFEWDIDGCCAMGTTVTSSCFSSSQTTSNSSAYGYGENSESLCGFQRLSYGQGPVPSQQTQSKANNSGFFSSLGGRICGTPKIDHRYESGFGTAPYPVIYGGCHMDDFGNENLMPVHSKQTQTQAPLFR